MARARKQESASGVQVVYSAAVSLDGYIAASDGGVDWLHAAMVKGESYGLGEFMDSIDGVLMGSRTYEKSLQMGGMMGGSKPCWVFSKRPLTGKGKSLHFTSAPPRDIVAALPEHGVHRAWLFGGGELAASFLSDGLIDEVAIGVMPVVLGCGIPLFGPLNAAVTLKLIETKNYKGGALGLRYEPVKPLEKTRLTRAGSRP